MNRIKQIIGCAGIVFCMAGCGDADLFRFDKMGQIEGWEPDITLSLAHASFSVWDAFNQGKEDTTTLKKDANGQLYFEYEKPDIYTLDVDSIYRMYLEDMYFNFSFPINPKHFTDGGGTVERPHNDTLRATYALENIPHGVYLEEAIVSMESMGVTIINNAHIGGRLEITCMNLYTLQPVGLISFAIDFKAGDPSKMFYTELPSVQAILRREHIVPVRVCLIVTDITEAIMGENVMIEMSATGVENKSAALLLPEKEFKINEGFLKTDIELLDKLSGKFSFANPQLCLNARVKGLGMKFNLNDMKFKALNGTEMVTLQNKDGGFQFSGNSDGQYYKDNLLYYTATNSNVVDFAALPPRDGITYSDGKVKCGGEVINISAGGKMDLDFSMRFPLEMSASELVFSDTIADLNLKDSDKMKRAALKIMGNNGLKMEIYLPELELLDENKKILGRIENSNTTGFAAATSQGPATGMIRMELTEDNLRQLSETEYIVLKLSFKTPGGEVVPIDDASRFDLKFLLDAKINMGEVIN